MTINDALTCTSCGRKIMSCGNPKNGFQFAHHNCPHGTRCGHERSGGTEGPLVLVIACKQCRERVAEEQRRQVARQQQEEERRRSITECAVCGTVHNRPVRFDPASGMFCPNFKTWEFEYKDTQIICDGPTAQRGKHRGEGILICVYPYVVGLSKDRWEAFLSFNTIESREVPVEGLESERRSFVTAAEALEWVESASTICVDHAYSQSAPLLTFLRETRRAYQKVRRTVLEHANRIPSQSIEFALRGRRNQ